MTEKKVFSWVSKILFFGSIASYFFIKLLIDWGYIVYDRFGSGTGSDQVILLLVILLLIAIIMGIFADSVSRYVDAEKTKINTIALNFFRISFYVFAFMFLFLLFGILYKIIK